MTTFALALLLSLPSAQGSAYLDLELQPSDSPPSTELTSGGLIWQHFVGSTGWNQLGLGDRGGQVLATDGSVLRLLSSFDANPPHVVWTRTDSSFWMEMRAASESDVYLYCDLRAQEPFSTIGILKKLSSRSPQSEWSFAFAEQIFSKPTFDLSRDGRTIVSVFPNEALQSVELRVHDPASGAALRTIAMPRGPGTGRFDLSPDGTVAAFSYPSGPGITGIYDLEEDRFFTVPGLIPSQQALSDRGRLLATMDLSDYQHHLHVLLHLRGPDGYEPVLDVRTAPGVYPRDLAVSEDGSTLAASWFDFGSPERAIVRAYDVATRAMTMEHVDASSSVQVIPDSVSIAADGSRFVVGMWGTGSDAFDELAVYSPQSGSPLRAHPSGGEVLAAEMSPDGHRYAAIRRLGGSQAVQLYEFGGEDLVVRGRPSLGETITFELHGAPGSRATLLRSFALAPTPIDLPGIGTLRLDPATLRSIPIGVVPPSGVATYSTVASTIPGMIGRTLWFQGLTSRPRHLTTDFVQLTILP